MFKMIIVKDCWSKKANYVISKNDKEYYAYKELTKYCTGVMPELKIKRKQIRKIRLPITGDAYYYLNKELNSFNEYKRILYFELDKKGINVLQLELRMPDKLMIDWTWNRLLLHLLWEKIEIDFTMSWLSTLGGGFSALGEQFLKCAEIAGRISMKQLHIGMRLGDPFMQARCKLYYSISLIQTGRLRSAKYIIREQYRFAKSHKGVDDRLLKMCYGIWHRLQFEYYIRLSRRQRELERLKYEGAGDDGSVHLTQPIQYHHAIPHEP